MANVLNFFAVQDSDRLGITVSETTGLYASNNIGGWGSPNAPISDVLTAQMLITQLGSTTTYTVDVSSVLPSSSVNPYASISIPYTSFGGAAGAKMPDGIWNIQYLVTFTTMSGFNPVSNDFYFSFIGGIKCCMTTLRQSVPIPETTNCVCQCKGNCTCGQKQLICNAILVALYQSICPLVGCDKLNRTMCVISYLTRYCCQNCSGCI